MVYFGVYFGYTSGYTSGILRGILLVGGSYGYGGPKTRLMVFGSSFGTIYRAFGEKSVWWLLLTLKGHCSRHSQRIWMIQSEGSSKFPDLSFAAIKT